MEGVRLVFYSCAARLIDEQARKNAEMAPSNSKNGAREATIFEQQIGAVIIDWFYENAGFSFTNSITTVNPEISQDYIY